MDQKIHKRCAARHNIDFLRPNQLEFDLDLPRGSGVIAVFFGRKKAFLAGQDDTIYPILIVDTNPDATNIPHRFAFIPIDAEVGHDGDHVWKPIGAYAAPNGHIMALYNLYTKDAVL